MQTSATIALLAVLACSCTAYLITPTVTALAVLSRPLRSLDIYCWRFGVVASVVRRMNEVTVHRARLVLGWVTVFGRVYHHSV